MQIGKLVHWTQQRTVVVHCAMSQTYVMAGACENPERAAYCGVSAPHWSSFLGGSSPDCFVSASRSFPNHCRQPP
jgi:hypothetical protein